MRNLGNINQPVVGRKIGNINTPQDKGLIQKAGEFLLPQTTEMLTSKERFTPESKKILQQSGGKPSIQNLAQFFGQRIKEDFGAGAEVASLIPQPGGPITSGLLTGASQATKSQSGGEALGDLLMGAGVGAAMKYAPGVANKAVVGVKNKAVELIDKIVPNKVKAVVSGQLKGMADDVSSLLGKNAARAANELYGYDVQKGRVQNFIENHSGKPFDYLSKKSAEITAKIVGDDKSYEGLYKNLITYEDQVGKKMQKTLTTKPKVISLEGLRKEIAKVAEKMAKSGKTGEQAAMDLVEEFQSMLTANPSLDRLKANELKSTLSSMLYSPRGKKIDTKPLSNGSRQAMEIVSNYLRKEVKDGLNPQDLNLFDEYGVIQAMKEGLKDKLSKVVGQPEVTATRDPLGNMLNFLTQGVRSPEFLQQSLSAPTKQVTQPNLMNKVVDKTSSVIGSAIKATPYTPAIIKALSKVMDKENEQKQQRRMLP